MKTWTHACTHGLLSTRLEPFCLRTLFRQLQACRSACSRVRPQDCDKSWTCTSPPSSSRSESQSNEIFTNQTKFDVTYFSTKVHTSMLGVLTPQKNDCSPKMALHCSKTSYFWPGNSRRYCVKAARSYCPDVVNTHRLH